MPEEVKQHRHKYKKIDIGTRKPYFVYRCFIDECNHYTTKNFLLNKKVICWNCEQEFVLNPRHFNRVKLVCCARPTVADRRKPTAESKAALTMMEEDMFGEEDAQ